LTRAVLAADRHALEAELGFVLVVGRRCVGHLQTALALALDASGRQRGEVLAPILGLARTEFVEVIPGVQARIVAVVEHQLDGVIADRLDIADVDVLLAGLQHRLLGAVAAHFGRRRMHAQVFAGQFEALAVVEAYLQLARLLVELDVDGKVAGHVRGCTWRGCRPPPGVRCDG
jgi:hypothetical protein